MIALTSHKIRLLGIALAQLTLAIRPTCAAYRNIIRINITQILGQKQKAAFPSFGYLFKDKVLLE